MSKFVPPKSPEGNIYATTILMAEFQRQHPEKWKDEVLPLKTGEEVSLYCHRNWVWEDMISAKEFHMKQLEKEDASGKKRWKRR